MSRSHGSGRHALHARLDELTGLIRARQRCSDADNLAIGLHLCEIEDGELWKLGNYSSLSAYAREAHGLTSGRTSELKGTARAYTTHAGFRAAFDSHRINYTQAREIAKAPPADYDLLIEKAGALDADDLRDLISGREGRKRCSFYWTEEQRAWVDDAATLFRRRARKNLPLGELLPELCRSYVEGGGGLAGPGRSPFKVILYHCPGCEKTTRQHAAGEFELTPAAAAEAMRDAPVVDLTSGGDGKLRQPPRKRGKVPRKVRDAAFTPHRHRCAVPGCRHRVIEFHHDDGYESGDDPARCLPLCGEHHRQRHLGLLRMLKLDGVWCFFRADLTPLGRQGDERKAATPAAPREALAAASEVDRRAVEALRRLGARPDRAAELVARAREREPGRVWDLPGLVEQALRARPPDGGEAG